MTEKTKTRLVLGLFIVFLVLCMVFMWFTICEDVKGGNIEILITQYPFWAVSTPGDSTVQAVQIVKCWETFPNGQGESLGYKVVVDSSGYRVYEGKPEYFLNQATIRALSLGDSLTKEGD